MTSRRQFISDTALAAVGLSLPASALGALGEVSRTLDPSHGFLDLHRAPDSVLVQTATGDRHLSRDANGRWSAGGLEVTVSDRTDALRSSCGGQRWGLRSSCPC